MNATLRCAALALALILSGCIVNVSDTADGASGWKDEQRRNSALLAKLELGTAQGDVFDRFGTPHSSEAFQTDGRSYMVYFYRTAHVASDGLTTRDETTPLIFEDRVLVGWGHRQYERLVGEHADDPIAAKPLRN